MWPDRMHSEQGAQLARVLGCDHTEETPTPSKRPMASSARACSCALQVVSPGACAPLQGNPVNTWPDFPQRQGPPNPSPESHLGGRPGSAPHPCPGLRPTQIIPPKTAGIFCPLISQLRVSPQLHTSRYKIRIDGDTGALPSLHFS